MKKHILFTLFAIFMALAMPSTSLAKRDRGGGEKLAGKKADVGAVEFHHRRRHHHHRHHHHHHHHHHKITITIR